jgi:hypothetical protein
MLISLMTPADPQLHTITLPLTRPALPATLTWPPRPTPSKSETEATLAQPPPHP